MYLGCGRRADRRRLVLSRRADHTCAYKGYVVTGGVNWTRISNRKRMRRQGVEDIKGKTPLVLYRPPKQRRRKLSKAELREQATAAFLAWREGQKAKDK